MADAMYDERMRHAESLRARLEDVWEAVDAGVLVDEEGKGIGLPAPDASLSDPVVSCCGRDAADCDCDGREPLEWLDEQVLAVEYERGEPFAVVFGVGGPHVEITGGGRSGGYKIGVYWSGETYVTGGAVTRTGDYYREREEELHGE